MVAIGLVLVAWAVTAALYPALPQRIPTHWNIHGKVDAYGSKSTLFLLPAVMAGMLALFSFLPALSPKNFEVDSFRSTYLFLMVLVIGLFGYIHGLLLYAARSGNVDVARALVGGVYLFFALMGNVLGKVRRNFYIGVRVPWTLASDRVWNDTHRVAAWTFVLAGLAGFVIVVAGESLLVSLIPIGVALVVPIVYAFVHYKQLERRGAL
jgi:uncharacterized membrane protein